jgi:hypothetical protein
MALQWSVRKRTVWVTGTILGRWSPHHTWRRYESVGWRTELAHLNAYIGMAL